MPSILHSAWLQSHKPDSRGELFLWARQLDLPVQPHPNEDVNGNRAADERQRIPSHPQQMALSQLRQRLVHQFPTISPDKLRPVNTTAWFPTVNGAPETRRGFVPREPTLGESTSGESALGLPESLDSTSGDQPLHNTPDEHATTIEQTDADAALTDGAAIVQQATLAPWQITGVAISAIDALHFLSQLSNVELENTPSNNENQPNTTNGSAPPLLLNRLRMGNDLLFFSNVAKFALEILASQYYLPSIQVDAAGNFRAIWQPTLLDAAMHERFALLVEEMPPVCRSYNLDSPAAASSATALVETLVANLVDSAIRSWSEPLTLHLNGNDLNGNDLSGNDLNGNGLNGSDSTAEHNNDSTGRTDVNHSENDASDSTDLAADKPEFQWLTRLLSAENRLSLPPQPSHRLYREWQAWLDQLHIASDAGFRICFKLSDPDEIAESDTNQPSEAEAWRLSYHLQSRNNPHVFIRAAEIWATSTSSVIVEDVRIDQPQERFLAGLGAVSHLFEPIKRSLSDPRPEFAELTVHEAYQFMREIGPLLQGSGFGVIVPTWWSAREERQLGLRLRLLSEGLSSEDLFSDDFLLEPYADVEYSWELTLGDERIDQAGLANLVALESPLIRIQGRWTELNPEQISAALHFLQGEVGSDEGRAGQNGAGQIDISASRGRSSFGKMTLLQALRMISQNGAQFPSDSQPLEPAKPATDPTKSATEQGAAPIDFQLDGLIQPPALLPVVGVDVNGWLDQAMKKLQQSESMPEIAEPVGFEGELRPYQRRGVAWLSYLRRLGIGACLADDMGLGKTIQAIALHLHIKAQLGGKEGSKAGVRAGQAAIYPTLLICPTSVLANWQREIKRFAPTLRTLVHHGNNRLLGDPFLQTAAEQDFIITSYGTVRRDIEFLLQPMWQDVILDEAQNIKNPNAKQTQAVRKLRSQHRIALTGTPIENRLSELWSIFEFLNPGYLGGQTHFQKEYILPIERYNSERHINQLRRTVQPFLLRRLKTDPSIISDLPEKNEMVVYCSLTQEQQQLYMQIVDGMLRNLEESEGMQRRGLILGLITKLKQIANHPAHFLKEKPTESAIKELNSRSGKLSRLTEMLEEALSVGDNALIFTQFVEMGTLLRNYLSHILGEDIPFLHGGCSAGQRDRMVQAFQSEDGPPVFILSLRAGGSGLNLTRANHVFHFDRWWNPAIENQATDRAFRIGQERNVQVHKFVSAGTLEEHIHELLESKKTLAENIVGSGEEWLTEMDNKQLRELLMLRNERRILS